MKRYLSLMVILSTLLVGIEVQASAQSIQTLEQKLSMNPQNEKILYKLTKLYCAQGMADEAIESWRLLADLDSDKASELYLLAWVSVFLGIEPFYPQPVSDMQAQQPRLSPDGKWIVFLSITKGKFNVARMDFFGQNFSWITEDALYHQAPSFAGSSDEVIYTMYNESGGDQLIHQNIATGETKVIFSNLAAGVSSVNQSKPKGPIVLSYVSSDTKTREIGIYDENKSEFTALTSTPYGELFPRYSSDGKLIVFGNNPALNTDLYIMNRKGKIKEQITRTDEYERNPDFGDSDKKIAFASNLFALGQIDIAVCDRRTGEIIPVTFNKADDDYPDMSDDGKWLIFQSTRTPEQSSVYFVSLDQHISMEDLIEEIDSKK